VCVVINVGKKPIEVTVEVVNLDATDTSETCTLLANDPNSNCQAFANSAGYCRVTTAGSDGAARKNLRAVMMNRQIAPPQEIYDSVEAR
jgi:hypothetical protein